MNILNKLLDFLNLLDYSGRLSPTNVALCIVTIRLAMAPQPSLIDLGALLIGLANYAHKRVVNQEAAANNAVQADESQVSELTAQVGDLTSKVGDITSKINAITLKAGIR